MHGTLQADSHQVAFAPRRDATTAATQYYLGSDQTMPAKVTNVTIRDQTNTRDSYHDEMGTVLWLITPFASKAFEAKPLFLHLDQGAKLEIDRDAEGKPRVALLLEYGPQRYELDPDHEFLPKRVTGAFRHHGQAIRPEPRPLVPRRRARHAQR